MKKLIFAVTASVFLFASPASADKGVTPMLKMNTTYHFVFGSAMKPAAPFAGRHADWYLAWEGTIKGDVDGVIRWWVEWPPISPTTGVGRFEIWDCEPVFPATDCDDSTQLIMAGYEAFGYVSATEWAGKDIVTYVGAGYPEYAEWFGRRTTDGCLVQFIGGVPSYGEGPFTIYNRPSNRH